MLLLFASYKTNAADPLPSEEFGSYFTKPEDRTNIERLRGFLERKDAQYNQVSDQIQTLNERANRSHLYDTLEYVHHLAKLNDFLKNNKPADNTRPGYFVETAMDSTTIQIARIYEVRKPDMKPFTHDLISAKDACQQALNNLRNISDQYRNQGDQYHASLEAIDRDRQSAVRQIQKVLDVEHSNWVFKNWIGGISAAIIVMLVCAFFYFIFKGGSPELSKLFLSGNGIQFITLFAIIISTLMFGILGVLEGRELAAILSGIAGFILGKGITPTTGTTATSAPTPPPGPSPTPAP